MKENDSGKRRGRKCPIKLYPGSGERCFATSTLTLSIWGKKVKGGLFFSFFLSPTLVAFWVVELVPSPRPNPSSSDSQGARASVPQCQVGPGSHRLCPSPALTPRETRTVRGSGNEQVKGQVGLRKFEEFHKCVLYIYLRCICLRAT